METIAETPPSFFLYGEAPRPAAAGFLHLEPLEARTRPSGWSIRKHRHGDLNHLFLMTSGGGVVLAEGRELAFEAPALLLVPAGVVHAFAFRRESAGQVLTLASSFLEARPSCGDSLSPLFDAPQVLGCGEETEALQQVFARLAGELAWRAPGHQAAVEAAVLQALVIALRLQHQRRTTVRGDAGRDGALTARFREQVELSFREHRSLQAYAKALGVSLSRLHQACRRSVAASPLQLIQQRRLLEAKRGLLYDDMPIAELAFDLGFDDPAYFSRFFAKHAGVSARRFRQGRIDGEGEAPLSRVAATTSKARIAG